MKLIAKITSDQAVGNVGAYVYVYVEIPLERTSSSVSLFSVCDLLLSGKRDGVSLRNTYVILLDVGQKYHRVKEIVCKEVMEMRRTSEVLRLLRLFY